MMGNQLRKISKEGVLNLLYQELMIPIGCPAEEIATAVLTASTFQASIMGQALSKLDHCFLCSQKARLG